MSEGNRKNRLIAFLKLNSKILAVTTIICLSIAFAGGFIISNVIHKETPVERLKGIDITVIEFPTTVCLGKDYTFTVRTQNILDQDLADLTTFMTIAYKEESLTKYIDPSWVTVTWTYVSCANPPVGYVPYTGPLPFTWDDPKALLIRSHVDWTAPKGFDEVATITLNIDARCPFLPDGTTGVLTFEGWVESTTIPP